MELKDRLRQYRLAAGYTDMKDFSENVLHIRYTTYRPYEAKGSWPNKENLLKICDALHTTPNDLLDYTPDRLHRAADLCKKYGWNAVESFAWDPENNKEVVYITVGDPVEKDQYCFVSDTFISIVETTLSSQKVYTKIKESLRAAFLIGERKEIAAQNAHEIAALKAQIVALENQLHTIGGEHAKPEKAKHPQSTKNKP